MGSNNVLRFTPLNERASFRGAASKQDLSEVALDIFRKKTIGLIIAFLVSLGLWGIIWLAVASFVSRVAG
jgi:hypothetical protein